MKSLGWQDLAWAVAIAAAAVGAFFFFRTPEPARTGLALIAQVCAGREARLEALAQHVSDPLELSGVLDPEGELRLSHAELQARLDELSALAPGCALELEDWSIRPGARGATWLVGELVHSDSQPSDLHARRRPLRALFREVGGAQRLERVVLGPPERQLPEARP